MTHQRCLTVALYSFVVMLAGCMQSNTVVRVNPDGSGTVIDSTAMSKAALQMIDSMVAGMAGQEGAQAQPNAAAQMFSPDKLQAKAAEMGRGVTFVGATPIDNEKWTGSTAQYAFQRIESLQLSNVNEPDKPGPPGQPQQPATPKKKMRFRIRPLGGGVSELTITLPPFERDKPEPDEKQPGATGQPQSQGNDAQAQAMMDMFLDMEFGLAIECGKQIIQTNATHVDGNRITLFHMALKPLLKMPERLKELQAAHPQSIEEMIPLMKGIEGFTFELRNPIVVKFR